MVGKNDAFTYIKCVCMCVCVREQVFRSQRDFFLRCAIVRPRVSYMCVWLSLPTPTVTSQPNHAGVFLRRQNENRRTGKTCYNSLLAALYAHILCAHRVYNLNCTFTRPPGTRNWKINRGHPVRNIMCPAHPSAAPLYDFLSLARLGREY